ncbi:uncharacterized protein LOC111733863 [Pteropus vampyrus]|uniref:Uncharacterized protein LOC111733863 n=1 Tax=Pteropus vampyrus TaxID=132908 RepID=A0A6P6C2Z1_PTEVA|nr:uncharacterized protein LOC111733863 [Pteropus vampyrus]
MHPWAGGRGLKQHKFILGTSTVTSTYPRASLPPEAPGEGPSCLSQRLGAPTVPGLVATSLLCLPLCPHGFSVSVSLVFCPLQGHSLDLGPPAPVGHILRSRVDMDFGGHYSASTAEIVFFQSSGGRGQEVPEPLNGSSLFSIREPRQEAACPSAIRLVGPRVLWPLRAVTLQALGLSPVLREPRSQCHVSLCDLQSAGLCCSRRVPAGGSPSFGLLDSLGAVRTGPRDARDVGARHVCEPLRWPDRGARRGWTADSPAGSCGGHSGRGLVPTGGLPGARWWGGPLEPRGDWPWPRGLGRGTPDYLREPRCGCRHRLSSTPRPWPLLVHSEPSAPAGPEPRLGDVLHCCL